ncbi:MAG TPA: response regulator, partial [Marinagarivorans sp.]
RTQTTAAQDTTHDATYDATHDTTKAPSITDDCLAGKILLLVEDIELNQVLAQQLLEDYGATVVVVNNGLKAVNAVQAQAFDAVIMDIQMPIMDGYQATKAIRKNPAFKRLPIIAMTANVSVDDIAACHQAGMDAHVGKPIDENKLVKALITQMHLKRTSEN